jgi:hypothetical protein
MGIDKRTGTQPNPDTTNQRIIGLDPDDPNANKSAVPPDDEEMKKWLKDTAWPQPKWLKHTKSEKPKNIGFEMFYINSLRARYLRMEGDFRSAYNNFYGTPYMDLVAAKLIIGYLQTSKVSLESEDCDVTDVITMLDLADQSMVWIYPPHYAKAQASGIASDLKGMPDAANQAWGIYLEKEMCREGQTLGGLRAALDKTKQAINEAKQGSIISTGLQIERLSLARKWSWYVLGISLILLPFVIKIDGELWKEAQLIKSLPVDARAFPWILMFTAAAFGAVGAFFSNLLSIQNTKTKLTDFQESLKNSLLKLNIGALAAMILFSFLTWQIIPGVELKNAGSLTFLAFLAGFSERFFLNLLNINSDTVAPRPAPADTALPPANPVGESTENVNAEKVN